MLHWTLELGCFRTRSSLWGLCKKKTAGLTQEKVPVDSWETCCTDQTLPFFFLGLLFRPVHRKASFCNKWMPVRDTYHEAENSASWILRSSFSFHLFQEFSRLRESFHHLRNGPLTVESSSCQARNMTRFPRLKVWLTTWAGLCSLSTPELQEEFHWQLSRTPRGWDQVTQPIAEPPRSYLGEQGNLPPPHTPHSEGCLLQIIYLL